MNKPQILLAARAMRCRRLDLQACRDGLTHGIRSAFSGQAFRYIYKEIMISPAVEDVIRDMNFRDRLSGPRKQG